jgi:hypothetical protein
MLLCLTTEVGFEVAYVAFPRSRLPLYLWQ